MAQRIRDMTSGKPAGLILAFALPLMLGNMFQQLYTVVDTAIVGRFVGVQALAAVGAADWFNWLIQSLVIGFPQGFGILMAQRFGAGETRELRKTAAMGYLLTIAIAAAMTALSLCLARPMLLLLNTPQNILDLSTLYLIIRFAGIPVLAAYNIFASMLRALGDSRTSLVAMAIASIINIALDLLFVCVFHLGVGGAAVATVLSQAFSGLYCYRSVRRLELLHLSKEDWQPDRSLCWQMVRLGAPLGLQEAIISVGGLVVQSVVNSFGYIVVAGYTATFKLYGLLELAASAFGFSVATYVGQNLGAQKYDRITAGMHAAIGMALITSALIGAAMILFGRSILSMFISGTAEETTEALRFSYAFLTYMAWPLPILYMLHLHRSAVQGMGDTVIPMWSGVMELILRISIVLLLPLALGQAGLYFVEVGAWCGGAAINMIAYYRKIGRLKHTIKQAA